LDIEKDSRQIQENNSTLKEIAANPALKSSLSELQKTSNALIRWVEFSKKKKIYYERKLATLSKEERKAPAYYVLPKNVAKTMDTQGNYIENISGDIPYEPEDGQEALAKVPLFTFIKDPFHLKLPNTAFQLIVIEHAFRQNEKDPVKDVLDESFFPLLPFKEMAALMYK